MRGECLLNFSRLHGIGLDKRTGIAVVGHRHTTVGVGQARISHIGHVFAIAAVGAAGQRIGLTCDRITKQYTAVGEQMPVEAGLLRPAVDGQRLVARVVEYA